MFPTGLVLGVYNKLNEQTMLNPPVARRIQQGDVLVMMRPTSVASEHYKPIEAPIPIDLGAFPSANEKLHFLTQDPHTNTELIENQPSSPYSTKVTTALW